MSQSILKLKLAIITSMNGIGDSTDNISLRTQVLPEFTIVKLALIGLTAGVINVLHIDKEGDSFQGISYGYQLEDSAHYSTAR